MQLNRRGSRHRGAQGQLASIVDIAADSLNPRAELRKEDAIAVQRQRHSAWGGLEFFRAEARSRAAAARVSPVETTAEGRGVKQALVARNRKVERQPDTGSTGVGRRDYVRGAE